MIGENHTKKPPIYGHRLGVRCCNGFPFCNLIISSVKAKSKLVDLKLLDTDKAKNKVYVNYDLLRLLG